MKNQIISSGKISNKPIQKLFLNKNKCIFLKKNKIWPFKSNFFKKYHFIYKDSSVD